jgi:hypothetical protein
MAAGGASRTSAFAIIVVAGRGWWGRPAAAWLLAGWPALAVKSSLLLPASHRVNM